MHHMACIAAAVPIIRLPALAQIIVECMYVYIPMDLLQAHNTIPQTGSLTNVITEMLTYGFYCNQAMAHN